MRTAVTMLGLLAVSHLAAADPSPGGPTTGRDAAGLVAGDCERARKTGKTCVLDLPAEAVTGDRASADAVGVRILVVGTAASLIRVRRNFLPEIVKAAEDL